MKFLRNSTKCWICDNAYFEDDVKVRDHCHVTKKAKDSAHRNCNIKVKLNHKIPFLFHNQKNYDSYLIMLELGKCNLKINVTPKGLEKHMSCNINNKLTFIGSFQNLISSLDSSVKNLGKLDFKYLNQEFDSDKLHPV